MRAQPSGLVTMHNCGHDLVLRRNVRIGSSTPERLASRPFLASGYGSHHIGLVNEGNRAWNSILTLRGKPGDFAAAPTLPNINSGETFGVVDSSHATTFGGLIIIKDELEEDLQGLSLTNGSIDDGDITEAVPDHNVPASLPQHGDFTSPIPVLTPSPSATISGQPTTNVQPTIGSPLTSVDSDGYHQVKHEADTDGVVPPGNYIVRP